MNRLSTLLIVAMAASGSACGGSTEQSTSAAAPSQTAAPVQAQGSAPAGTTSMAAQSEQTAMGPRGALVAKVNGVPIYKSDFETAMSNFMQSNGMDAASHQDRQQVQQVVLDGLIGSELLHQKAKTIPIQISRAEIDTAVGQAKTSMGGDGYNAELAKRGMTQKDIEEMIEKNLMVQKLINDTIAKAVQIDETEIKKFYDEHPNEMTRPADVEASHILVKSTPTDPPERKTEARKKIDEALQKVKAGEDFGAMAQTFSEDSTAARGGALGAIHPGQTVPAFEQAAFKLAVGQISDVVESQFGYHIIKVTAKHDSVLMNLDEVKDRISSYLKQQKTQEAIQKTVDSLRASAKVEVM
jgi:parvulin-like peptidyl-prolyl isomerase